MVAGVQFRIADVTIQDRREAGGAWAGLGHEPPMVTDAPTLAAATGFAVRRQQAKAGGRSRTTQPTDRSAEQASRQAVPPFAKLPEEPD